MSKGRNWVVNFSLIKVYTNTDKWKYLNILSNQLSFLYYWYTINTRKIIYSETRNVQGHISSAQTGSLNTRVACCIPGHRSSKKWLNWNLYFRSRTHYWDVQTLFDFDEAFSVDLLVYDIVSIWRADLNLLRIFKYQVIP